MFLALLRKVFLLPLLCVAFFVGGAEGKVTKVAPPPPIAIADGSQCGPVKEVRKALADKYGEKETFDGIVSGTSDKFMFAVFSNEKTGTWTGVMISSDGMACLMTSGEHFAFTTGKGA